MTMIATTTTTIEHLARHRAVSVSRPSSIIAAAAAALGGAALLLGGCEGGVVSEEATVARIQSALSDVDPRRSLVATEQPILASFTLKRVMDQLVKQSGVGGLTSLQLFRQLWDTQNPPPGLGLGANCTGTLNGYPYDCRAVGPLGDPSEGGEVNVNPFAGGPAEYIPIGLFNRFDLAPGDGAHCGEHRIVYARRSGISDNTNRNLVIFEFTAPNPKPALGLKGCQNIVKFWADLSGIGNLRARTRNLEIFYFTGIDGHGPVVHVDNLGHNALGVGQIRTNQFLGFPTTAPSASRAWLLREFKLTRSCGGGKRCLQAVPVSVKTNPFGPLFTGGGSHPRSAAFQADFVANQVPRLAAATLAGIDMKISDLYNTGQSYSSGPVENNYLTQFAASTDGGAFRAAIAGKLASLGSSLTPEHIVARAQALSCAGCHRLNARLPPAVSPDLGGGLVWPPSLGFVHVTEQETETAGGVVRFVISKALTDVFLPARKKIIDDFIDDKPLNPKDPQDPLGGRRVH